MLVLDLTLRYEINTNNEKVPSLMTLYEPWIWYKVFHSINLPVYTPSTPRTESYFDSHRGWIFIFVTIQIWAVLLIGWSKFWRQPGQCFIGERISPPTIQRQTHLVSDVTIILPSRNSCEREDSGNEIVAVLFVMLGSNILIFARASESK